MTITDPQQAQLVVEFFAEYEKSKQDPQGGPDPAVADLEAAEEEMASAALALELMEIDPAERDDLKGKRAPDMLDIMNETAEGLRECPAIQQAVQTAPEVFEQVAAQDLSVGVLIQVMQTLHSGTDTGWLLRAADAEDICDTVDKEVQQAIKDPSIAGERRDLIGAAFAEPATRRQKIQQRAQDSAAAAGKATGTEAEGAKQAEDQAALDEAVRELIADAVSSSDDGTAAKPGKGHGKKAGSGGAGGTGNGAGQGGTVTVGPGIKGPAKPTLH